MPPVITLIEDHSLRAAAGGFEIKVRLNWYRSLPLSCVEQVSLAVDGKPVDPQAIRIGLNDRLYRLDELAELTDQIWYVQDSARLWVEQPGWVARGQTHQIEAEVVLRAPYILVGPDRFLTMPTRGVATQVAE